MRVKCLKCNDIITSNARMLQPQFSYGIPSASANHLVKGMIDRWGKWLGDERAMLTHMRKLIEEE